MGSKQDRQQIIQEELRKNNSKEILDEVQECEKELRIYYDL